MHSPIRPGSRRSLRSPTGRGDATALAQETTAMCFKNLPIEFDVNGNATLREGTKDPYAVAVAKPKGYVRRQEGPGAALAAPPRLRDWNIDPMTRVAGALAVHCVLDLENRVAVEA